MDLGNIKDEILLATLSHVVFDGWTSRALAAGVADAGHRPDMALRAFPDGMREVVEHFSDFADRRMVAELERRDLGAMRIRDRIATAVGVRLELLAPYREAVLRATAFVSLPQNAGIASRCAYRTVDAMWYAAGDTSTDFNFYTKRALLAAVYGATVLCWLGDASEDFTDTWDFLERRIENVMSLPKLSPKALLKGLGRSRFRVGPRST